MSGPITYVYDIETYPHLVRTFSLYKTSIGPHQIVEPGGMLCFAAQRVGASKVEAHAMWSGHEEMVRRLFDIMDEADYLVGYNLDKFDNRKVNAAFAEYGLGKPSPYRSVDLYKTVKKNFDLPSYRLAYVSKWLGLEGKADDGGFDTWLGCLDGDELAQRRMLRYNRQDVRVTTQVFEKLLPWISGLNVPLYDGDEEAGDLKCTRCGGTDIQSRGWAYTTTYRYRRYQCQGCKGWMRDRKSEPTPNAELRSV